MIFDVLECHSEVWVSHKNSIQKVFLGWVQQWPIGGLAAKDFIINCLRITITERSHTKLCLEKI